MDQAEREKKYDLAMRFYKSLLATEKLSKDELQEYQWRITTTYLNYVEELVPFYRDGLAPIRNGDGTYDFERWNEVPLMSKEDIVTHKDELKCRHVPREHGGIVQSATSASTGISLRIPSTQLTGMAIACAAFRHAKHHKVDWSHDLVKIRAHAYSPPTYGSVDPEAFLCGPAWVDPGKRGTEHHMSVLTHPAQQIEQLKAYGRVNINTLPSNLRNLLQIIEQQDAGPPEVAHVLSIGELVEDNLRASCEADLGCKIVDVFATAECGPIATECPVSGGYHVIPELAIVEILDDEGRPCGFGKPGRIVVTPLMNLAMPLVRYQLEDYASFSPPCPCGRSAPLIGKIHGRKSSLFDFGHGRIGPLTLDEQEMQRHLKGCTWKVVQSSSGTVELQYQLPGTARAEVNTSGAADVVRMAVGGHIPVDVVEVPALGITPGGKYQKVLSDCLD